MDAQPNVGDIWYRYEDFRESCGVDEFENSLGSRLRLRECTYEVVRVTPKGVWLSSWLSFYPRAHRCAADGKLPSDARFVRLECQKKYAGPTKEAALASYLARKESQMGILQAQLARATEAHAMGRRELAKLQGTEVTTNKLEDMLHV